MKTTRKIPTGDHFDVLRKIVSRINQRLTKQQKIFIQYGIIGFILLAVSVGHFVVKDKITDVFYVYVNGMELGIVSEPAIIEDYKMRRKQLVEETYPNAKIIIRTDLIEYSKSKGLKKQINNEKTIEKLDEMIRPKSFGAEIKVDGKVIAIVKDKETANQILEELKKPYDLHAKQFSNQFSTLDNRTKEEFSNQNLILRSIEFLEDVHLNEVPINPEEIEQSETVIERLKTGNVEPIKYVVEKGDCISCIAHKFNLTTEYIFQNNPWLKDDKLNIGDVLDLTVLQPAISIKTVSELIEKEEIRYATEYELNDSMRNGLVKEISPGKNGLKQVQYQITKINGNVSEETVISEEIIENPIHAKAYRGTKVIIGQGSGKFTWPVTSPRISSAFGTRWGSFHKGIDITGNKTIKASDNGKVIAAGYDSGGFGYHVIIDHMNGYKTLYGHLSEISVSSGTIVEKNEQIGVMGNTGYSMGVHLHFEIIENGISINPLKFLNY